METISFLLKTYCGDAMYWHQLRNSFTRFNADGIKLYVVAPREEMSLFESKDENIKFIAEEELPVAMFPALYRGKNSGWLNQQIVKLSFWELGICENYFCLDSDCYFIKYFHVNDFMHDEKQPFTVFYDDRELMTRKQYYNAYGRGRERYNRIIQSDLGISPKTKLVSSHGFSILSSLVLQGLKERFMIPRKLDYKNLIIRAPLEFTWYNYWLQREMPIAIYPTMPLIKTYHSYDQLKGEIDSGVSINDLKRYYLGIVVNSIFGKERNFLCFEDVCDAINSFRGGGCFIDSINGTCVF